MNTTDEKRQKSYDKLTKTVDWDVTLIIFKNLDIICCSFINMNIK